jgi:hypothetical protein
VSADFRLADHGSICLLYPLTPAAREWAAEHLPTDAFWCGAGMVIEPRYVAPIVDGIQADGLTFGAE